VQRAASGSGSIALDGIVEQDRAESLKDLKAGRLDLAVIAREMDAASRRSDPAIERRHLLDEYVDVMLPLTHRLATAVTVSRQDLAGEAWADCGGGCTSHMLAPVAIEPMIVFTSDKGSVLQQIVASGIAVCFISRLAQHNMRPDVIVKPVAPDPPVRSVEIAVRFNHQTGAVQSMIDMLHIAAEIYRADEVSRHPEAARPPSLAATDLA
jgi:DNA-binding transcriptional LysR family regulator